MHIKENILNDTWNEQHKLTNNLCYNQNINKNKIGKVNDRVQNNKGKQKMRDTMKK